MAHRILPPGRAACALALLAAICLVPVPSPAKPAAEPAVDLRRIRIDQQGVTAPLLSGKGSAQLTLQPKLQQVANRLLARANPVAGAIVLVHTASGKTLVWSERRRGGTPAGSVLLDLRAPSASLFKIVTTAALLEKAQIPPHIKVCTHGGKSHIEREHLEPPGRRPGVHCTPFSDALGHSRNAVFAQLATRHLLRDDLAQVAQGFGFNRPVPFNAAVGMGTLQLPYNDLEFARAATGFQDSTLSPLGALLLAYAVAAGGQTVQIRIVEESADYHAPARRRVLKRIMSRWTAVQLRRMMEVTVHSGTSLEAFSDKAGRAYLGGVRVAGKTGTLHPTARAPTTTWFVGFAPSRAPRVVLSVLVQNGPVWRRRANEVARDMLRAYFLSLGYRGITDPLAPGQG
jgi:peptidoglycan glycosyltransferase